MKQVYMLCAAYVLFMAPAACRQADDVLTARRAPQRAAPGGWSETRLPPAVIQAGAGEVRVRLAAGSAPLRRSWRAAVRTLDGSRTWLTVVTHDPDFTERAALAADGVDLLSRVEPGLWWVRFTPGARAAASAPILAAGPAAPRLKVSRPWSGRRPAVVMFHPGATRAGAAGQARPVQGRQDPRLTHGEALQLASEDAVSWIEPRDDGAGRPLLDGVRKRVNADAVQGFSLTGGAPSYANGGKGITLGIFDGGYAAPHVDFGKRLVTSATGWSEHATHVAGVAAGDGSDSKNHGGAAYQWRGVAPEVSLISKSGSQQSKPALPDMVINQGMDLSNTSLAVHTSGQYDTLSAGIDAAARGAAGRPHTSVMAVANNGISSQYGYLRGYYSVLANAKNALLVGDSYHNLDHRWEGSSMGPTWDGRLVPTVMAPADVLTWPAAGRWIDVDYVRFEDAAGKVGYSLELNSPSDKNGWLKVQNASDFQITNGALRFLSRLAGIVISPDDLPVPAGYPYIRIRLKVGGGVDPQKNEAKISWGTTPYCAPTCKVWAPPKGSKTLKIKADGTWEVLLMNTGASGVKWVRLFPHTGSSVSTTAPKKDGGYGFGGQTSNASPVAAGCASLVLAALHGATGRDQDYRPFLSSTLRALMINTAVDMVHKTPFAIDRNNPDTKKPVTYGPGPDWATGFGRVDVQAAAAAAVGGRWLEDAVKEGGDRQFEGTVPAGAKTLKVTLVWDDPPAAMIGAKEAPKLVHDLDLEVIAGAKTHLPLVLVPPPHEKLTPVILTGIDPIDPTKHLADAKPGVDTLNPVEQVVIASPAAGPVTVRVKAAASLSAGPWQTFSVVASVPLKPRAPCKSPSAERCNNLDDDCNTLVDDGLSGVKETCDLLDNDCDGTVDEGCGCALGRPCLELTTTCKGMQACQSGKYGQCVPLPGCIPIKPDTGAPDGPPSMDGAAATDGVTTSDAAVDSGLSGDGAPAGDAAVPGDDEGGCSCDLGSGPTGQHLVLALILLLGLVMRSRYSA